MWLRATPSRMPRVTGALNVMYASQTEEHGAAVHFFAEQPISKGEELSISYNCQCDSDEHAPLAPLEARDMVLVLVPALCLWA